MRSDPLTLSAAGSGLQVPVHTVNTLIIGAGAAALRCATALYGLGQMDIAVAVDRLGAGTSNNSGSDKQTYYKIGLFGDEPDSPMDFARTLHRGGMMHGDIAYVEALGSAPAFFELCRLGVPFPFNRYGAYVGYKTDHDPKQRATSAGPKTSIMMFRALLAEVRRLGIPVLDGHEAVRLLVREEPQGRRVIGAACLDRGAGHRDNRGLALFNAQNVVLATGGPGEMYRISVWPQGQLGSHGLALEIGARANNLTELQFGLASLGFRWNLSGTFQQVVPDYFSTAADGRSERRQFLHDYHRDMAHMATNIFLKGYQWPFHAERLQDGGSSLIDIAVHNEIAAGRRVFIDFSHDPVPAPGMGAFSIQGLRPEARSYLERSGALQPTPYERLLHMNPQAVEIYAEHGVDLRAPLEVAVCAQHCNGGLSVNVWWESNIRHLFPIGEVAGTHGVRPGGSALNAGQVGAMRAARYIAEAYRDPPPLPARFLEEAAGQVASLSRTWEGWLAGGSPLGPQQVRREIQERMSREAAFIRTPEGSRRALQEARALWERIGSEGLRCASPAELPRASEDRLLALASLAFLEALAAYIEGGGGSRGGYMVLDPKGGRAVKGAGGRETLRHRAENPDKRAEILEAVWDGRRFRVEAVPVRPLPVDDSWFETVWAAWSRGQVVTGGEGFGAGK